MSSPRNKIVAVLVATFVLGGVTGGALGHVLEERRAMDMFDAAENGSRHGVFLWSLERKLDLSDAQEVQIAQILARYDREMGDVTQPVDPEMKALRKKMRDDVRAVLTPEQAPRYDELTGKLDDVRARARGEMPASSSSP